MILCIDAGNSSVKFCLFDGKGNHGTVYGQALKGRRRSWDAIVKSAANDQRRIRGAIISSVVPRLTPQIARAVERVGGKHPILVDARLRFPFRITVPRPGGVGVDRLCCAAGVIDGRRSSAILIDIGSAVTVDLVLDGEFRGGIILAGPDLALRALARNTEKLPLLAFKRPLKSSSSRFDSTESSLQLGAQMSTLGGIRESARLLDKAAGRLLVKFLTGGAAAAFSPLLPRSWRKDPHLVLKGLYRLWELNSSR